MIFSSKDESTPFILVKDSSWMWPSFNQILYSALDYEIVVLNILWFFLIDTLTGNNSMLAIFIVYVLERCILWFRMVYGKHNFAKKAMMDSRFLV